MSFSMMMAGKNPIHALKAQGSPLEKWGDKRKAKKRLKKGNPNSCGKGSRCAAYGY